jgi:hypothetical protein
LKPLSHCGIFSNSAVKIEQAAPWNCGLADIFAIIVTNRTL